MAIKLSTLMKKVSHMDISLLAGRNGLDNMVNWIHMVETKEAATFLEGREITFITGIGLNNSLSILDLITYIYENEASGAVLNLGPFLEDIPREVIDFGDAHDFPIFTVPWKIHIAEIMRIFCFMITKSDQANLEIASAFKNAIFFPKQEELYVVPLSRYGFHINWNYYCCVLMICDEYNGALPEKRLETIASSLNNTMKHNQYKNFTIFHSDKQLMIVLGDYTDTELNQFITILLEYLRSMLSKTENYYIGIGKCTKSLRCLYKSYGQSLAIQNLQMKQKISKQLISYTNMGIYKLLMGIEDKEIIQEYYEKTIHPLDEFDRKNNSDLSIVLRSYLIHNGSVKDTADELFVHRNTVNYKLSRISELLGINLSNLDTRLQLTLGFMLKDML